MNKAIGFDSPCYGQKPYADEAKDRAYEQAFEDIYQEVVENLKGDGFDTDHEVSILDVFDNMVLTGIDTGLQDSMICALRIIRLNSPKLQPLIDKEIEYIARITAEHELEKS